MVSASDVRSVRWSVVALVVSVSLASLWFSELNQFRFSLRGTEAQSGGTGTGGEVERQRQRGREQRQRGRDREVVAEAES